MMTQEGSVMNKLSTNDVDMDVEAVKFASFSSADSNPPPTISFPVKPKRGRPVKNKQKSSSVDPAQSSAAPAEDTKQFLKSIVSTRGHKKGKVSGADSRDFASSTRILKKMLLEGEDDIVSDSLTTDPSLDSSQLMSEDSFLTMDEEKQKQEMLKEEEKKTEVGEEERDEVVNTTPKKRKPGRPPKKSTHQQPKDDETLTKNRVTYGIMPLGEEGDEREYVVPEVSTTPKKRKPGRPPKKATQQSKEDEDEDTPTKKRRLDCDVARLPGTKLKICSHCGTVADKVKAKKCYKCKKFFFSHWARRCKIPPCPSCHFSRKSRRFERIPSNCEKCGFKLPSDLLEESAGVHMIMEDGDGMESLESGSTSVRITPDPAELDQYEVKSVSAEWEEGKQCGRGGSEEYMEMRDEYDEEEMEDMIVEKYGKGEMKKNEGVNWGESSDVIEAQHSSTESTPTSNKERTTTLVMATTRSGRAYKHDTTPERTYGSIMAGSIATLLPQLSFHKPVRDDNPSPQEHLPQQDTCRATSDDAPPPLPSLSSKASPRGEESHRSSSVPSDLPIIMSQKEPPPVEEKDCFLGDQSVTEQALLPETTSDDNHSQQLPVEVTEDVVSTKPLSPAHTCNAAPSPLAATPLQTNDAHHVDATVLQMDDTHHVMINSNSGALVERNSTPYSAPSPKPVLDNDTQSPTLEEKSNVQLYAPEKEINKTKQNNVAGEAVGADTQPVNVDPPIVQHVGPPEEVSLPNLPKEEHKDAAGQTDGESKADAQAMGDGNVGTNESIAKLEGVVEDKCNVQSQDSPTGKRISGPYITEEGLVISSTAPNSTTSIAQIAVQTESVARVTDELTEDETTEGKKSRNITQSLPFLTSVQTESGTEVTEELIEDETSRGEKSVFRNITQSLPFLRSVLTGIDDPKGSTSTIVQCRPAMPSTSVITSTTTSGTQSLPVLYTANLGLEDAGNSTVAVTAPSSGDGSLPTAPVAATASTGSEWVSTAVSAENTTPVFISTSTAMDTTPSGNAFHDKDMATVFTNNASVAVTTENPPSGVVDSKVTKKPGQSAAQKPSKGKKASGKDGKLTTPKKKKQPKTQEGAEGASKEKQTKPKKPRAKKSKTSAVSTSASEQPTSLALSMLANSIAQELQRKPSVASPVVPGQHPKHSFSQYFYSEENKLMSLGSVAGSSGTSNLGETSAEITNDGNANVVGKGKSKRAYSKQKDSLEPPIKKKKLANIAPHNPLTSAANSGSGLGPQMLKTSSSLTPPTLLPQLYQLAATLKMSSSNLLNVLQSVFPQKPGIGGGCGTPTTSSASVPNPASLPAALFPPLTMSFQSLAAALSSMPIATTPIRLSGTQVTARPLLPSTLSSSLQSTSSITAPSLSMTLPSTLPTMFPSLGTPSPITSDQLATLKGVFSNEASVGTQTMVKIDALKPLLHAPSSLSPQLLTLPNPPQLTSGPASPTPPPPPTLVPKDLKPVFQSVLSHLPSIPPPLTSHPAPVNTSSTKVPELRTSTVSAVHFPVIKPNGTTSTVSYMTLPMTSAGSAFSSLPILPMHSTVIPFPAKGLAPPIVPNSGVPLQASSLPEPTSQPLPLSIGSLLPPPPYLLPQSLPSSSIQPLPQSNTDSLSESNSATSSSPIIPSLLRPGGLATTSKPEPGGLTSMPPPPCQQQVIYTQSITSPKVCPVPQPASTPIASSVDSNLQVVVSSVQTRINEALAKTGAGNKPVEPSLQPSSSTNTSNNTATTTSFSLAPPPLTSTPPITFVSKGSSNPPYILPHPPPHPSQKKRGVVITKLPGPLSTALSHSGGLSREGSRHSSTSSIKSGDDPAIQVQSVKSTLSDEAVITGVSSSQPVVITLSPSPTASLEEQQEVQEPSASQPKMKPLDQDSDKESDSYAKLMSEETLGSDPSSEGEEGRRRKRKGGGHDGEGERREIEVCDGEEKTREGEVGDGDGEQQKQQHPQTPHTVNNADGTEDRRAEKGKDREGREGGEGDGDKGKGAKKRRKSSSGGSGRKAHMFSVKLKDCFLHHLTWMDYRMVLLVPLGDKQKHKHKQHERHKHQHPSHQKNSPENQGSTSGDKVSAGGSGEGGGGGGGERRRRRKPVLKELSGYNDMEEDEDDTSQSTTSSLHVPGPCFSVYELRNKLFQTLSPNAVYIYTYKNQIKSFKLPIHWVYILKRMGGMLESCHTCRLMDLEHVRGMCHHYGLTLPETLDPLCRNELPKGRRVIDLSSIEPENLGPLHLEQIPLCSFTEKGRPYKPKAKKNKKKWRKDEEHRVHKKGEGQDGERAGKKDGGEYRQSQEGPSKIPTTSTSSQPLGHLEEVKEEGVEEEGEGDEGEGDVEAEEREGDMEGEEMEGEEDGEEDNWIEEEREWKQKHKYRKQSPPPLIKHLSTSPIASRTKKKPCPFCGTLVLKRSKKCNMCNKNFGVYTFGRKQCLFCGRVNLARMARCNECGQSLDKAPSARPKGAEDGVASGMSTSHKKSNFIFGVRKRQKVHSVPLAFSDSYKSYLSTKTRIEFQSRGDDGPMQQSEMSDEEDMEEGGREEEEEEEGGEEEEEEEEEGEEERGEEVVVKPVLKPVTKPVMKPKTKSTSTKSKHASYQYGHIPWADADITVLVDERGVPKFCLQELASKVLVGHTKAEVFEMVRDLDLPLEQGNIYLLKKLQALGLHANRSPMCKLIAAEELWLLLDALQEPVPEEVHQHLENINTSTTPLLSPSGSVRTPTVVASAPVATSTEEEEQSTSFESTLHEMQCSDGQYISVLRTWNGEQFACLPELWRKYFPEVNRNHLSSALRRLMLETHMPTGQQATLLRSAQVISVRGAPGRLMKLEDMQTLLEDFCIPLQLASTSKKKHAPAAKDTKEQKPPATPTTSVSITKPVIVSRPVGRPRIHSNNSYPSSTTLPPGKVLASKEDMEYAQCMRHVLAAVNSSDLVALLEQTRLTSEEQVGHADSEAAELDSKLDRLGQLIHSRRELSTVLSREMGFLNASVHGYMSEVVRLAHAEKQVLQNLDSLLHSLNVSLL